MTKFFGPKVGGLAAMVPLAFTLTFVFTTYGQKTQYIRDFIFSSVIGLLIFGLFLGTLYFLNKNPDKYWLNLTISYAVWFAGAFAWIYFKK